MLNVEILSLRRKIKANLKNARIFKALGNCLAYEEAISCFKIRRQQLTEKLREQKEQSRQNRFRQEEN